MSLTNNWNTMALPGYLLEGMSVRQRLQYAALFEICINTHTHTDTHTHRYTHTYTLTRMELHTNYKTKAFIFIQFLYVAMTV